MKRENFYKKLIQRVKSGTRAARIPRSFSKKRNNVFSNEQHIVIQVLMQLERKRLRDMPRFLLLLQDELHLARAIHFTTINKFALRVKQTFLELIIASMVKSSVASFVAIDGTGFSLNARSPYFCTIAGERQQFMQTNVAAELNRKLVVAVKLRRKRRNENIDVKYLIKQTSKQLKVTAFLGDGLFDAEGNHETAHEYNSEFIAPIRKSSVRYWASRGKYRKRLMRHFPKEVYAKRKIIEGIFSAIKRRFGHLLLSKRFDTQKNELLFRFIAYNAEKLINLQSCRLLLSTRLSYLSLIVSRFLGTEVSILFCLYIVEAKSKHFETSP